MKTILFIIETKIPSMYLLVQTLDSLVQRNCESKILSLTFFVILIDKNRKKYTLIHTHLVAMQTKKRKNKVNKQKTQTKSIAHEQILLCVS